MAKFLTGHVLNAQIEKLFEDADEELILISPYFNLHDNYAAVLKSKKVNANLKMTVVFGKNEDDLSKSLKREDFIFFREFPNIEIRYEKRLHAKYYANESSAILTSMNLYSYSQDHNIEAGVIINTKGILNAFTNEDSLDKDAYDYFRRVIEQSDLLFSKKPKFESTMLGLSSRYTKSVIEIDKLSDFFSSRPKNSISFNEGLDIPKSETKQTGFCIRTGVQIPFNPKHPMCEAAFQSWKKFGNKDYQEKYCHFSGELSSGETSFSKPILRKNWAKAKQIHKF